MRQNSESPEILLLSESEPASVVDRRALRDAGFGNARVMTSGIEAAKYLSGRQRGKDGWDPGVVVCSQKLEDMDGEQFCAIIRQHPLLLALPVLLLLPNDSEAEQLKALGCGASAILGRPYSIDVLRDQLLRLSAGRKSSEKLREAAHNTDTSAFDAALASYGLLLLPERHPDDYFRAGMKCLEEKKWSVAICAFQYALQDVETEAEAQLGMAAAYKGKGDMLRFRQWLARASETLVRAKRWNRARASFARVLQHDPDAKNPFLAEARRLIRQKEYDAAALVLAQGVSVIPKAKSGEQLASVCMGAEDPAAMMRALSQSLEREDRNNDYLSAEIRQSLEIKTRERDERQKAMAAERKWQLSRQLAEKCSAAKDGDEKRAAVKAGDEKPAGHARKVESIADAPPPSGGAINLEELPVKPEDENEDYVSTGQVLPPLTRNEATSGLFGNTPKVNEFLSVVKLTWNLSRRAKKKDKGGKQ